MPLDLGGCASLTNLEVACDHYTPVVRCPSTLRRLTVSGIDRKEWPSEAFASLRHLVHARLHEGTREELAGILLHCPHIRSVRFPPFSPNRLPVLAPSTSSTFVSPFCSAPQHPDLHTLKGVVLYANEVVEIAGLAPQLQTLAVYTSASFAKHHALSIARHCPHLVAMRVAQTVTEQAPYVETYREVRDDSGDDSDGPGGRGGDGDSVHDTDNGTPASTSVPSKSKSPGGDGELERGDAGGVPKRFKYDERLTDSGSAFDREKTAATDIPSEVTVAPCLRTFEAFTGSDYGLRDGDLVAPLLTRLTLRNRGPVVKRQPVSRSRDADVVPLDLLLLLRRLPRLQHLAVSERNVTVPAWDESRGHVKSGLRSLQLHDSRRTSDIECEDVDMCGSAAIYRRKLWRKNMALTACATELDLASLSRAAPELQHLDLQFVHLTIACLAPLVPTTLSVSSSAVHARLATSTSSVLAPTDTVGVTAFPELRALRFCGSVLADNARTIVTGLLGRANLAVTLNLNATATDLLGLVRRRKRHAPTNVLLSTNYQMMQDS